MAAAPFTDRQILETREAIEKTRNTDGGVNITNAARVLGVPRQTMQSRIRLLGARGVKFTKPTLPSSSRELDELIRDRLEISRRSKNADEARDLITIPVHIDGPFGLLIFGDPHVDDDGCDFESLAAHRELAISNPYILPACVGDISNNWVGRLGRLYGDQQITAREAWKLVEWLISPVEWLFLIAGNHDLWSGAGDPLDWISRQAGSLYEPHGVRIQLKHPCGAKTRIHARHDFPGHSIYSAMHGPRREMMMGFRDHIIIAGHRHCGGQEGVVSPDGIHCQLVRVSGYKAQADSYARQLGLKKMPTHPSALILIDPRYDESSPARAWCAPTVSVGLQCLMTLRKEYENSKNVRAKKDKKR